MEREAREEERETTVTEAPAPRRETYLSEQFHRLPSNPDFFWLLPTARHT